MLLKLAWRNVFRQKRRTILTLLTMTGGFMLSSVSIGWMQGSYDGIIMFFTDGRTGQIQVHGSGYLDDPSIYNSFDESTSAMIDTFPGVRTTAPRIYSGALLAVRPHGAGAGAVFCNSAAAGVTTRANAARNAHANRQVVLVFI